MDTLRSLNGGGTFVQVSAFVCGNKCAGISEDSAMLSSGDIQVGLIM